MGHILYYNLHLFFSVFFGLEILLGCGLNMIIKMSVVLKNIVIRDSDLTTRAYSVCFPERIKSHIRPLVVLSKFLTLFNVWQEWATSIFLNIYTSSRVRILKRLIKWCQREIYALISYEILSTSPLVKCE